MIFDLNIVSGGGSLIGAAEDLRDWAHGGHLPQHPAYQHALQH